MERLEFDSRRGKYAPWSKEFKQYADNNEEKKVGESE